MQNARKTGFRAYSTGAEITDFVDRDNHKYDLKRRITQSTTVYLRRDILIIDFVYQKTQNL